MSVARFDRHIIMSKLKRRNASAALDIRYFEVLSTKNGRKLAKNHLFTQSLIDFV